MMDMSKSSRRKQTKPIRVYEGEEAAGPDQATPAGQPPAVSQPDFTNGELVPTENGPQQREDMPVDLHVAIITCTKCSDTFPSKERLMNHMNVAHSSPKDSKIVEEAVHYNYPTAYHRLGSEFQQENKFISNGHADSENIPPETANVPEPKNDVDMKDVNGDPLSGGKDGSRIFHQDAYCELCDREFCNKYFLKTHKANKHGIYENAPSPFSMTPGQPSMILPQEPVLPSPFKLESGPEPSQSLPPKKDAVPSVPTSFKLDATPHKTDTPSLTATTKSPVSDLSTPKVSNSGGNSSSSSGSTTQPDMEDYCEICQKHFCNKYYLKKHKQDVHGIVPENSSSSGKRSRPAFDIPITATVTSSPMILPQTMANMAGLPNMPNMPGVMVLNPFMPPVALIPTQSLLPQQQVHPPPSAVISQPMPVSAPAHSHSDQVPASSLQSTNSSTSLSSVMSLATSGKTTPSIPNDALRSIGVLNAEAYCELCRKEFCNKYFLRIHMANKHGVFTDDLFPPSPYGKSMDALENSMLSPVKASPKEVKQEPGSQSSPSGTDSYITFCNLCNKEFSSKYSYKIHRMNVHGMLNESLLEPALADGPEIPMPKPDIPTSEGLLKVASEAQAAAAAAATAAASAKDGSATTIFGNMIAAKLADRVVCDICNKELCNKYFLKAHKLRIHGIDISPQEKAAEAEKSGPYDSPNSKPGLSSTPKSEAKDLSAITAEMITADILQRSQNRVNASKKLDMSNIAPNLPSEKPSNEELVKLGIDPEAYCEICKKEFCSKYFLRTHRLNIHGIRTDKTEADAKEKERKQSLPKSSLFNTMNGFGLGGLGALGGLGGFMGGMHGGSNGIFSFAGNGGLLGLGPPGHMGLPASLSPLMPEARHDSNSMRSQNGGNGINVSSSGGMGGGGSLSGGSANSSGSGSSSGGKTKDRFQKHTWRWKEPVNSSRVSCEICNKELCNKYFLRTHKLNKHGIIPSDKSPSMGSSPAPSDCETASNASSQPDQSISDRGNQTPVQLMNKTDNTSPHPSPTQDKSFEKTANQLKADLLKFKNEEELNNRYMNNQYSEVCNLCDRRFKSSRWLKAHILKDHAGWPMLDMFDPKMAQRGGLIEPPDPKACTVCGLVFPSELSMQLHLIQEHNAQVTLKTEESQHNGNGETETPPSEFGYGLGFRKRVFRADKQKLYACVLCDYKTKWLSNLTSHEMKMHNLSKNSSDVFTCKLCPKSFPSELLLSRHVENLHDEPLDISSSGSNMKRQMKRYKCRVCGDKFHSRIVCNRHLREVHIRRKKNFETRNKLHRSKYSCSQCSYSTRYPQQLQRHRSRFHRSHSIGGPAKRSLEEIHAQPLIQNYMASAEVQCFELAVNTPDSTFLPSVAHMPVRQRVSEPMAVTFILTPVNP